MKIKLPKGKTEDEILKLLYGIAHSIAPKFTFGHYDRDDIVQEAVLLGIEGLEDYNESGSVEGFLWAHMSNRIKNFKRDNFVRPGLEQKHSAKINLAEPISLGNVLDEKESNCWCFIDFLNDMQIDEIFGIIDAELPISMRADFLRMKDGITIIKPRRERLIKTILDILRESGYETW